jgi:Type II secretory pathway, component PulD
VLSNAAKSGVRSSNPNFKSQAAQKPLSSGNSSATSDDRSTTGSSGISGLRGDAAAGLSTNGISGLDGGGTSSLGGDPALPLIAQNPSPSFNNNSPDPQSSSSSNSWNSSPSSSNSSNQGSSSVGSASDSAGSSTSQSREAKKIAQSLKPISKLPELPTVTGTVKIRKPFKLFAQAGGLIHHLSFRETPVREVISEIARRGNLNIIIDKSVTGKITGELTDVTLNEAMDNVLAAAGLESRTLDNSTVVIGTLQAMVQLGLNRPVARAFKLSYAHPFDVASILQASIFNRGYKSIFQASKKGGTESGQEPGSDGDDLLVPSGDTQETRSDEQTKTIRGSIREQMQEGVGFNNAAVDPGTQQIRQLQALTSDFVVSPNDGGTIVIPDAKGRQVFVVGTEQDVLLAEEAIHLLDKRPKQIHIQASLVELSNQGVRQLGATFNVQGQGLSASIMGNSRAPLLGFLPGLGSTANSIPDTSGAAGTMPNVPFVPTSVTPSGPGSAFSGLVGSLLPAVPATIAGVTPLASSQSGFDFLTLGGSGGGAANIATMPTAINLNIQMLLQTNKAKVIANPSLVVVDDTEALIAIANEVIHKVTSTVSLGVVTTNVELAKAGIFLNVLPRATEDGFVRIRLRPQVSTPLGPPTTFGSGANQTTVTLLNIRDVLTQEVRIKDGQTLVIGGLFTEQEAATLSKVPYLAEMPVLGAFFRTTLKGRNRTELMLLITPKIVEEEPQLSQSGSPTI